MPKFLAFRTTYSFEFLQVGNEFTELKYSCLHEKDPEEKLPLSLPASDGCHHSCTYRNVIVISLSVWSAYPFLLCVHNLPPFTLKPERPLLLCS